MGGLLAVVTVGSVQSRNLAVELAQHDYKIGVLGVHNSRASAAVNEIKKMGGQAMLAPPQHGEWTGDEISEFQRLITRRRRGRKQPTERVDVLVVDMISRSRPAAANMATRIALRSGVPPMLKHGGHLIVVGDETTEGSASEDLAVSMFEAAMTDLPIGVMRGSGKTLAEIMKYVWILERP